MLTLLPIILLLITALAVFTLRYFPRGTGYAFLTSLLMILLIWGGVLAYHWIDLSPVVITPWRPFDPSLADPIQYGWDNVSWPFGFALVSACLAIVFTAGARLQMRSSPVTWAANIGVAALGLLVVIAETPLALVLALVPLDLLDMLVVLRLARSWKFSSLGVMAFVIRCISTFMIIGALAYQRTIGIPMEFTSMSSQAALMFLLAIGIRLGLLPLNMPYAADFPFQRGLISFLRLAAYAGGLAALARISSLETVESWQPLLFTVTLIASLYGAVMWFSAHDEIEGRQYWLLTTSGLGFLCVLLGNPAQTVPWGLMMIFGGAFLFLFSARGRRLAFLPVLATLMVSGLPFSISSVGWPGLMFQPFKLNGIFLIVTVAFVLAGFIKHAFRSDNSFAGLEGWVRGTYPMGLTLLLISGWLAAAFGIEGGLQIGVWFAGAASIILAGGLFFIQSRVFNVAGPSIADTRLKVFQTWWGRIKSFLRLSWLYQLLWSFYRALRRLVAFFTLLFEGEGGVLWAILLLVLMLTLLATRTG